MADDIKRALRGAWPGAAIEPDATLRAALLTRPIRYGWIGAQTPGIAPSGGGDGTQLDFSQAENSAHLATTC